MPSFTYAGLTPRAYPESRDEQGVIVGQVYPGDTFSLAGPLDADWFPEGTPPDRGAESDAETPGPESGRVPAPPPAPRPAPVPPPPGTPAAAPPSAAQEG